MDLTSAITNFQQAGVTSQIQIAVAKKILDAQRADGNTALQLLESASNTSASSGDALVAAATGLGGQLDTYG